MIQTIGEMMSHAFIQRAILVGILITLCAAVLGVILVLKRYSMIGDRFVSRGIWRVNYINSFWSYITTIYCYTMCYNFCYITFKNR